MSRLRSGLPAAGLVLLLLLFGARLADSIERHSLTVDEPHYIGTGLYLWATGDYHFAKSLKLQPPLAFHLASVPLLLLDTGGVDVRRDVGRQLLAGAGPSPRAVRLASRAPFALLAVWGALLAFLWAREAAGDAAGLLATFLYTFSPMLLAHGSLAHSDIAVTVLYLQTLYAAWRYLRRPTPGRLAACGASLGLALLAKLSALLLLAMLPPMLALHALGRLGVGVPAEAGSTPPAARLGRAAGALAGIGACALAVFWVGYGGSFDLQPVASGPLVGVTLPGYLHAFLVDRAINEAGRETYFLGAFSQRGWWYFFPAAFAVKAPLGLLVLLGLALAELVRRPSPLGRFLAIPFAVYLGVACLYLDVPLGLRYVLPLHPLLCVFVATQLAGLAGTVPRAVAVAAAAWMAVASLAAHPHYLSYFHELAGGPARGPRYLLDANIDWGQDLPALAAWLARREGDGDAEPTRTPVWMAYFGPEPPQRYGIRSRPLRGCEPVGGTLAISVNVRYGLYASPNPLKRPDRDCYAWLDRYEPVARPGGSILVYELPAP